MSRSWSSKNLKKIAISSPISTISSRLLASLSSKPSYVVILRVKYDFFAETPLELTVKQNDFVKFIERPGDGWILVKNIDKTSSGLIPASYVDIVVNDVNNPISLNWLNEIESPQEIPLDISVCKVLQMNKKRFAYRVDVIMSSGIKIHLAKYYLDFYNLHNLISARFASSTHGITIPTLPRLSPHISIQTQLSDPHASTAGRGDTCTRLNFYMKQLLKVPLIRDCQEFFDFINDESTANIKQSSASLPLSDNAIEEKLLSGVPWSSSTYSPSCTQSQYSNPPSCTQSSPSEPAPLVESPSEHTLSTFSSLLAGYDIDDDEFPDADATDSGNSTDFCQSTDFRSSDGAHNSSGDETVFSSQNNAKSRISDENSRNSDGKSSNSEPQTPILDYQFAPPNTTKAIDDWFVSLSQNSSPCETITETFSKKNSPLIPQDCVKIKIILGNDDNDDKIVLRVKKSELISSKVLRQMLLFKIYKDANLISHYLLQPLHSLEKHFSDNDVLQYVKESLKAYLRLRLK